jgi:predicted GH43/DUF377 family glycosyl hydrolase
MVPVHRTGFEIKPNHNRVVFRPFFPGGESRAMKIMARVNSLSEGTVKEMLQSVFAEFHGRHARVEEYYLKRYNEVKAFALTDLPPSRERQLLLGAFFTNEYSLESAALFNPSIVWHPDQYGLPAGTRRFVLSLRSTGEGHISSITFRSGTIDAENKITLDTPSQWVTMPDIVTDTSYEKKLFEQKLLEMKLPDMNLIPEVMEDMSSHFTMEELQIKLREIESLRRDLYDAAKPEVRAIMHLAQSNYEVTYHASQPLSERVIFPHSPTQSNGIEDARFVQFTDTDGEVTYYATYSAYDGRVVLPQLLETKDFTRFKMNTLNGPEAQHKGMALFPRRIDGSYAMISRQDGENIYIMFSENLHFWYAKELLIKPSYPWEFTQMGNCGSPIETDAGWLLLTHGVGPVRKYSIGAVLLDKDNPRKVIGRLKEPLLSPDANEREGYVPNVVYSCGGTVHNDTLILPYAMSDYASSIALVPLKDLLAELAG